LDLYREDAEIEEICARIWGDDIHYGLYEGEEDRIEEAIRRAKAVMAEPLPLSSDSLVLQVSCGYGGAARYLAERFGCRVVATDASERQLREARCLTAGTPQAELISFELADYHRLPFRDAEFDCWWCQEALLQSTNKPRVLTEAFRVLKPGGYAVLSDQILRPIRFNPQELRAVRARLRTDTIVGPADYTAMIQHAGFELLEHRNWQKHAAIHRRKIRDRLAELMPVLIEELAPDTLERGYRTSNDWAELAEAGKLGFDFYLARKPSS